MSEELIEKRNNNGRKLAVILCSAAAIIAAAAVFAVYFIKKHGDYKLYSFVLPFLTLALFTSIVVLWMPRLIDALSGRDERSLSLPETRAKSIAGRFALVCGVALILHIAAGLLGAYVYRLTKGDEVAGMPLLRLWHNAWMKLNTDAGHYLNIAENGYVKEGQDALLLVFFPLFPALIARLNLIFRDYFLTAQILNTAATCLTAGMTYLTLRPLLGDRRAVSGAFIYLLLPGAIFMNSPMTEPLFMLLTVCGFYCIGKKQFVLAAVFTALAGYTRSLGVLLIVPLAIAGIGNIVSLAREHKPWLAQAGMLLFALAVSTLGTFEYLYLNYSLHGKFTKFLEYQESNWFQKASPFFDTPRYYLDRIVLYLGMDRIAPVVSLWVSGSIAIFGSLAVMLRRGRSKELPAGYTAYFICYFAVAIGCTWLLSAMRYLCAAFPVAAALAVGCNKKWKTALTFTFLVLTYLIYMWMYMLRFDVY